MTLPWRPLGTQANAEKGWGVPDSAPLGSPWHALSSEVYILHAAPRRSSGVAVPLLYQAPHRFTLDQPCQRDGGHCDEVLPCSAKGLSLMPCLGGIFMGSMMWAVPLLLLNFPILPLQAVLSQSSPDKQNQ